MPDFSFLRTGGSESGDWSTRKGTVQFKCESCGSPMTGAACHAGDRVKCPMCSAIMAIPFGSEAGVEAIGIEPRRVSDSMWQIKCPRCKRTTNFRDSSWGGQTKCRNCGFKMTLPGSPDAGANAGCLGVVIAAIAMAAVSWWCA
jgi:DNA-directed RNA polymerase subunit RPC12/RpoP